MKNKLLIAILILGLTSCTRTGEEKDLPNQEVESLEDSKKEENPRKRIEKKALEDMDEDQLAQGLWGDFNMDGKEELVVVLEKDKVKTINYYGLNFKDEKEIDSSIKDFQLEEILEEDKGSIILLKSEDEESPSYKIYGILEDKIVDQVEDYEIVEFSKKKEGLAIKYINDKTVYELRKYDPRDYNPGLIEEPLGNQKNIQDDYIYLDEEGIKSYLGYTMTLEDFRKYEGADHLLKVLEDNNRLISHIYRYENGTLIVNLVDLVENGFVSYFRLLEEDGRLLYAYGSKKDSSLLTINEDTDMNQIMTRSFRGFKSNEIFPFPVDKKRLEEKLTDEDLRELEEYLAGYPSFSPYFWERDGDLITIPLYYKEGDQIDYRVISYKRDGEEKDHVFYTVEGKTNLEDMGQVKSLRPGWEYKDMFLDQFLGEERYEVENLPGKKIYDDILDKLELDMDKEPVKVKNSSDQIVVKGDGADKQSYYSKINGGLFEVEYQEQNSLYSIYFTRDNEERITLAHNRPTMAVPSVSVVRIEGIGDFEALNVYGHTGGGFNTTGSLYYRGKKDAYPKEKNYMDYFYFDVKEGKLFYSRNSKLLFLDFNVVYDERSGELNLGRVENLRIYDFY